jgi:hypothetical protein
MNELDKLRVLIPHWIEHNEEHAHEFRQWAEQAGVAEADILLAAEQMRDVNEPLAEALEKLGGPLPAEHHYHHDHGHHHHEE